MCNCHNLTPFSEIPPERHRELSAKGGIASGVKRRERRDLRQRLEKALLREAVANEVCQKLTDKLFAEWALRRIHKMRKKHAAKRE